MKYKVLLVFAFMITCFFLVGCKVEKEESSNANAEQNVVQINFTKAEKEKMGITDKTSTELYCDPLLENQCFVKVITENDWSEALYWVTYGKKTKIQCLSDGIIDDITFYKESDFIQLPDTYLPLILAVTSSSHMGNGETVLYVFRKNGKIKKLLCIGGTVDRGHDSENGAVYEGGRQDIYFKKGKNGYCNIIVSGREYQYGLKENNTKKDALYQIVDNKDVYVYDKKKASYQKKMEKRKVVQRIDGVISWHEYWKNNG